MKGSKPALPVTASSDEHFFTDRAWGWSRNRRGETESFRVEHPVWNCYPVVASEIDLDWGLVYGEEWAFLTGVKPFATALAVGSEIKVFTKGR